MEVTRPVLQESTAHDPSPLRSLLGTSRLTREISFRIVCLCQIATVGLTFELWDDRSFPPLLPAVDLLPDIAMALPMLSTLVVSLVWPRVGTGLHVAVLAYAVLLDQTRLQPEFISLALLMIALAIPSLTFLGRAHLVTLWVWAGSHKLMSLGFATGGAAFIAQGLGLPVGVVQWMTPVAEISVGMFALIWSTRYIAVVMAFVVHGLILLTLLSQGWNSAVWPWNIALPVAAICLLLERRDTHVAVMLRGSWRVKPLAFVMTVTAWALFWLYPAGFYTESSDTYLAHNLYTSNTRSATVCSPLSDATDLAGSYSCSSPFGVTWTALNVPLPPETRLFRQWFEGECLVGDVLQVSPIRTRITDLHPREYACPNYE